MTESKYPPPMTFRVNEDERKQIEKAANTFGMAVGTYIRHVLLDAPQTRAVYRASQTRKLILRLIGHIGRVGNNMNQIAWKLNSDQMLLPLDKQTHEEGVTALREMRAILTTRLGQPGPC